MDWSNKRKRNKPNGTLITQWQCQQMLYFSSFNQSNQVYCFRVINALVTLSIHEPFISSSRSEARNPPPHPVAIDPKVAETTLPLLLIAVSTPHEVTQWTRSKASVRKKNNYHSHHNTTNTWNKEFLKRESTTDWGRSVILTLLISLTITNIRTNQIGDKTNGTTEISKHLTMNNTCECWTT